MFSIPPFCVCVDVQLMDLCIPPLEGGSGNRVGGNSLSFVTMVTELGTGVDIIRLLQMTWEERLKVSHVTLEIIRDVKLKYSLCNCK